MSTAKSYPTIKCLLILSINTITRAWKEERLAVGAGGLTGAPLLQTTAQLVRKAYSTFGGDTVIIASGGISSGQQAWDLLRAGASAVQVYTGMIYKGFRLPAEINGTLSKLLDRHGVASVAKLRG